jgi:hypothetical protein
MKSFWQLGLLLTLTAFVVRSAPENFFDFGLKSGPNQPKTSFKTIFPENVNHMKKRIKTLFNTSASSLLVHVHIPKAGGTALAEALSSSCKCKDERNPANGALVHNCKECKQVRGAQGYHRDYSVSRSTGWLYGVHSPYPVLRFYLEVSKMQVTTIGLHPMYIIMLRLPYERFLSESKNWVGSKGQTVDWSIKAKGKMLPNIRLKRDAADRSNSSYPPYVTGYAGLPSDFIIHNRQAKMIGGLPHDFNMFFDPNTTIGSRWRGAHFPKASTPAQYLQRAYNILGSEERVLLLLQERFGESICTLEILYGHLYKFNWLESVHSHNKKHAFQIDASAVQNSTEDKEIYSKWLKSNKEDLKLYEVSEKLFDLQFAAALALLNTRDLKARNVKSNVPHCLKFITLP